MRDGVEVYVVQSAGQNSDGRARVVMDALPARRRSGLLVRERVGSTGRRVRKIMVVALARKLLDRAGRFVIDGVLPEGAVLKPAA